MPTSSCLLVTTLTNIGTMPLQRSFTAVVLLCGLALILHTLGEAQASCGELGNTLSASYEASAGAPSLGQRFQATSAVTVTSISALMASTLSLPQSARNYFLKSLSTSSPRTGNADAYPTTQAALYYDDSGAPGSALSGGSLLETSATASDGATLYTFTPANAQIALAPGYYWVVLVGTSPYSLTWRSLQQAAPASSTIALLEAGYYDTSWTILPYPFRASISGCTTSSSPTTLAPVTNVTVEWGSSVPTVNLSTSASDSGQSVGVSSAFSGLQQGNTSLSLDGTHTHMHLSAC
jgi:hypothetical protein